MLKPHYDSNMFQLPGYSFISNDRPDRAGGGIGLYIHDQVNYCVLPELTCVCDVIECMFVELQIVNRKNVIIACIYRPPNSDINAFNDHIHKLLKKQQFWKKQKCFFNG